MSFVKTESFCDGDPTLLLVPDVPSIGRRFLDWSSSCISAPYRGRRRHCRHRPSAYGILQLLLDVPATHRGRFLICKRRICSCPALLILAERLLNPHWNVVDHQYRYDILESCTWLGRTTMRVFPQLSFFTFQIEVRVDVESGYQSTCAYTWNRLNLYLRPYICVRVRHARLAFHVKSPRSVSWLGICANKSPPFILIALWWQISTVDS
jgi:hypothetical protein